MKRTSLALVALILGIAVYAPKATPQSRAEEDDLTQYLVLVQNESTPTCTPTVTPTPTATPSPTPRPAMVRVDPNACQFDPPGTDGTRYAEEWICLRNLGECAANLQGWWVCDESGASYTFPAYSLGGGAALTLHTGTGIDVGSHLYWGSSRFVWNNGGDTVYLYNAASELVTSYSY